MAYDYSRGYDEEEDDRPIEVCTSCGAYHSRASNRCFKCDTLDQQTQELGSDANT